MQITIIAIGQRMPEWVEQGYKDYARRLPSEYRLQLIEIPAQKRPKNSNIEKILNEEGKQLLAAVPKNHYLIGLDRTGKSIDTIHLANQLQKWNTVQHNVCFLIGGPEGITAECLKQCHEIWSLSKLTFPHALVRVILAEQLYRSWAVIKNHPYHR
jgi:23S rRNA (pseudouridine1915-N3)-methyltransferase